MSKYGKKCKPSLRSIAERNVLVEENQGLVVMVLNRLPKRLVILYGSREDAFQYGCLALIRAAELWDDGRHLKFSTYASDCIRWSLLDGHRKGMSIYVPPHNRLCRDLARIYSVGTGQELGTPLDCPTKETDIANGVDEEAIRLAVSSLPEDVRDLIISYYWGGRTLGEIGDMQGVSKERIRQRLVKARDWLRELLQEI